MGNRFLDSDVKFHSILNIALILLVISLSACSTSSGGRSEYGLGDQRFSDEDLAFSEQRFGEGTIPQASEGRFFEDILFEYDSSVVSAEYREKIRQNSEVLKNDPSLRAEIEGHCDKRGTNEYNLALGEERAKSVAALMVNYGARPAQLSTISYGEEIPIDPGNNEVSYAKNRRVHFALFRAK